VADASFSAIELIAAVRGPVCFITRLKLDANLFAPAPKRHSRIVGGPSKKRRKLPKLTQLLRHVDNDRNAGVVRRGRCRLQIATGTAIWHLSHRPKARSGWMSERVKHTWPSRPCFKRVLVVSSLPSRRRFGVVLGVVRLVPVRPRAHPSCWVIIGEVSACHGRL
jgi:hypothetical protein